MFISFAPRNINRYYVEVYQELDTSYSHAGGSVGVSCLVKSIFYKPCQALY